MTISIGEEAPEFDVPALDGRDVEASISSEDMKGQWTVLFFYPMDFTFVCPTELVEFNDNYDEFVDRDAQLIGGSTDTAFSHLGWVKADDDLDDLQYPLFADVKKEMAEGFDILNEDAGVAYRATFILDPENKVRWANVNDMDVGRSVDETIRVLDALQTGEMCACGREKGGDTIQI